VAQDPLWLLPADINADIRVEQIAGIHRLKPFTFLGSLILASGKVEVIGEIGQQFKRPPEVAVLFAEDNLVASAEDFDFLALEAKLLG
jgi:hypothetical protein